MHSIGNFNLQRNIAPPINLIDKVAFHRPDQQLLANGIQSWFFKGGSQPIVKFELLFKAGSFQQEKPLQAYATANLIKNGTLQKSSEEINKLWDYFGVSLVIEAQKDIISIGFFCLVRHLNPVLDLMLEIVTQAIFPEEELEILLMNRRQKHIVNQKKIQHLARIHFNEMLFGNNHPYGRILTLDDYDNLYRDDLINYHQQYLNPTNCVCLVSGNYPDDIVDILNSKFNNTQWKGTVPARGAEKQWNTSQSGKHRIFKDGALQSSIRIGKSMINRYHPDFHKVSIVNTLLGGYFGSRLMRNIRQEKGYTYGINSAFVSLLSSTYFFISTQVGDDVKDLALKEIYIELQGLKSRAADEQELSMLKNYLSAGFLRSFDGPFMQMEKFKEILLFGLDYGHYENFLPTLNGIEAKDIQEMGEKYFNENDMLELVVGQ